MKNKGKIIVGLWLLLLFTGCSQQTSTPLLSQAEACIDSAPDSALQLLRQIPHSETLTGQAEADYSLLMTQAAHKNDLPFTDSLVSQALPYFTAHHQPLKAGKCHFYKGVLLHTNQPVEAMQEYQQALDQIEPTGDLKYTGMCYEYMAMTMTEHELHTNALEYYQKALLLAIKRQSAYDELFAYKHLGVCFTYLEQYDSAAYYFKEALSMVESQEQWEYAELVNNYGLVLCLSGETEKALEEFEKLNSDMDDPILRNRINNSYGYLLLEVGDADKAEAYLLQCLESSSKEVKFSANHLLYIIYKEKKNYQKAVEHIDEFLLYNDSLQEMNKAAEIAEIENQYLLDKSKIQQQADLHKRNATLLILSLVLLLLIVSSGIIIQRQRYRLKHQKEVSSQLLHQKNNKLNSYEEIIAENEQQITQLKEKLKDGQMAQEEVKQLEESITHLAKANQDMAAITSDLRAGKENLKAIPYRKAIALYDQLQLKIHPLSEEETEQLTYLFECLYPHTLEKLEQAKLGKGEIAICIFSGLGLSNPQICRIRNIQLESIHSIKSHIRRKLLNDGLSELQKAMLD